MTVAQMQSRASFVLGLVIVAFVALLARLAQIQLHDHGAWKETAGRLQWARAERIPAERGRILDRNGQVLALTDRAPSVAVDPELAEDMGAVAAALGEALGVRADELALAIDRGSPRFAYVRRHVADRDAVAVLEKIRARDGLRAVCVLEEPIRVYPGGHLAAHIVGFTDMDGKGLEGVERLMDGELTGTPGRRKSVRDGRGRRIALAGEPQEVPVPGRDVHLTLDAVVQTFAEQAATRAMEASNPKGVVAAVVDVKSGELLALACRPTFDPNEPAGFPAAARRNRFFCDVFEPGSTFKPVVMGLALHAGAVRPDDIFDCAGGTYRVRSRTVREDEHHDYGVLTAAGVIARSSNVGMVQVGLRTGIDVVHDGVRRFGFGARSALRWPGESGGLLTPREQWSEAYTLCSVSFGHEIAVTPAQLLMAYATLANGGLRRPLRLLRDAPAGRPVRVLDPSAAAELLPMLEEVLRTGTARAAALPDYRVAGKTGTAQKMSGAAVTGHVGSFACFGPVENPRLAVLVICDEPEGKGYGSRVAAPFATELLRRSLRYLGVPATGEPAPSAPVPLEPVMEVYPR